MSIDTSCPHEWIPQGSWDIWIEWRVAIAKRNAKTPLTAGVIKLAVKALTQFRLQGYDPGDVLEACVNNGWTGVWLDRKLQPVHKLRAQPVDNVREFKPINDEQREALRSVRNSVKVVKARG